MSQCQDDDIALFDVNQNRRKIPHAKQRRRGFIVTYHGLLSKVLDLLDGARSSLLEGNTVDLFNYILISLPSDASCKFYSLTISGLHQTEHTLLCKWMVYSRATTSEMALRPALGFCCLVVLDMATIRMDEMGSLGVE